MNKKIIVIAAVALVALTGCTDAMNETTPNDGYVQIQGTEAVARAVQVTTKDGQTINCVILMGDNYRSGLSCDWDSPVVTKAYAPTQFFPNAEEWSIFYGK